MSRGEFIATATLLALILASFTFYFLYESKSEPENDLDDFKNEVEAFYAAQQTAADSIEAARAARDSAYRNSRYRNPHRTSNYWHNSYDRPWAHERDAGAYSNDTASLKPLPKKQDYAIVKVDLNHCDTSDITRVPTFGSKRARKIVEYRDKLGGFHSLTQLREIYILQNVDLALCEKYFSVNAKGIKKIHINRATYKELIGHPYMDTYLAKTITNHISHNGKIKSINEFKEITHAYQALIDKLTPYLCFD